MRRQKYTGKSGARVRPENSKFRMIEKIEVDVPGLEASACRLCRAYSGRRRDCRAVAGRVWASSVLCSDACVCVGRRPERYSDSDLDVEATGVSIAYGA